MPDSFENRPRAAPKRNALATAKPAPPPTMALGVKAQTTIHLMASNTWEAFMTRITAQPST